MYAYPIRAEVNVTFEMQFPMTRDGAGGKNGLESVHTIFSRNNNYDYGY